MGRRLIPPGELCAKPGTKELVPGGVEAEARQAMENPGDTLETAGAGYDYVLKCAVHLADIEDWGVFNGAYVTYFPNYLPARMRVGVRGAGGGGLRWRWFRRAGDVVSTGADLPHSCNVLASNEKTKPWGRTGE